MKTVKVEYGGFSAEQEVEENLYNAIYQQGKKDEQDNILWWFHNHDYILAERVMNQYLEQIKEHRDV